MDGMRNLRSDSFDNCFCIFTLKNRGKTKPTKITDFAVQTYKLPGQVLRKISNDERDRFDYLDKRVLFKYELYDDDENILCEWNGYLKPYLIKSFRRETLLFFPLFSCDFQTRQNWPIASSSNSRRIATATRAGAKTAKSDLERVGIRRIGKEVFDVILNIDVNRQLFKDAKKLKIKVSIDPYEKK